MAEKSYNEIPDLNEDWGFDKRNELKYSGESVQAFIKKMIREVMADTKTKYGGVTYESGAIRFYDEDGGTQLGVVTITGTSYSVSVATNVQSSNFTVLTSDTSYPITLTPTTTAMEFGSTEQTDYPEDYTFKLEVDSGVGYVDRTPENNSIRQGETATVDIRQYLKVGTNRIRFVVTGVSSEQPRTLGYTVTLTSLSLSCSHPWHQAWIQGQEFAITNIFFGGNIAKTLHVKVGDTEYTKDYTASTSYDKVPTTFDLTNNTPEASGVTPVELWMTGDGVETKHIHYNIMYVSTEDVGKVSMICTNKVKTDVYNFTEETLLEYAVYNVNELRSTVKASYKDAVITLLDSTQSVIPQTVYQLKMSLQIDTVETSGISLEVSLSSDDIEVINMMNVDNSNAYLATEGYKFYFNSSLGNNDSADREVIQNSSVLEDSNYKAVYPSVWTNFTFADDAWGRDTDGNRALVVKAGSELTVTDLKPLQFSNTKSATIEMMYRASNIADYDTPIITCIDTEEVTSESVGFIVYPTRIVLLGTGVRQELFQQLPLSEDRIHHIGVVIQRGYAASSLNLARIYINGCENVTFQFSGGNMFYNASGNNQLRIGQLSTDSYWYMMRIYDIALEANQMFANYLNALIETAEASRKGLREDNNITDGTSVSYDLCKKAGFNCLVIEIEGDKPIPSLKNPVEYSSGCNYHFEYNDNPEWNVSIYDAPMDRQGTTSSLYAWSNLRAKIKNQLRWVYPNLKDSNGNVLEEIGKDGYIAGYGLNPKVSRITWKKNIASQPQGHKMGATMMYNNIYKRIMGGADKLVSDKVLPTTGARVAVYQYPFMGFQKFSDGHYEFIGLYTGGPDKGDKKTFGYNETSMYPSLMMIEGPNHDPYLTRFLVPWTSDVFYDASAETLSVGARSASDGARQEGWDADIVADYSSDDLADESAIQSLYETEFKPAYDSIYYNSPYIASLAESGYTLEEINANVAVFQRGTTRGYANTLMTFYDTSYNLVYYRVKTGKYEVLDKSVHNMLTYLGLSGSPTTDDIVAARTANWLTAVSQFVNMREAYYRQVFDEFIGASDNDAKNSYWRKFLSIALGGKWGFNEDDLDTIFQNDNNGQDTKAYYVEPDDTSSLGADIFQGRTSAFWFALRQNCKDQLKGMFSEMIDAMYAEAEALGLLASTVHQTIFNLIDYYFWRHSSKYFPATAYNQDTQLAYINVWYEAPDAVYNNVPPLTQIHGDHYETEREWVSKRIAYMFSKYQIAAFEAGQADGYGSLEFTPAEGFTMNVTPAIDLYPRVSYGGSVTENSQRTKAGETCPLALSASGTTGNYIKGMDWLSDLGDLTDLKLSPRSATDAAISFSVKGKRLRNLKVGDASKASSDIKFNAATLGVESEALEVLDARNASTIEGSVSLQKCPRIREAYLSGTKVKSVIPPTGGRLMVLELPDTVQDLILNNLNLLQEEGLQITETALGNIRNLYVNSCNHINPVDLLQRIFNTEGNQLTAIGIVWKGWLVDQDGTMMQMFSEIAKKAGVDGGYSGVDFTNDITPTTMPNVSGALDASGLKGVYQEDIDAILLKLPNLLLKYDSNNLYVSFADAEVKRIVATNWGDGTGITQEQVEAVTDIGTVFRGNTVIETFDEFEKFTGVTIINKNCFGDCTNLSSIKFHSNIYELGKESFCVTPNLLITINLPSLRTIGTYAFAKSGITNVDSLGYITTIPDSLFPNEPIGYGVFSSCLNLTKVILPPTLEHIGKQTFMDCVLLEDINIPSNVKNVGKDAFKNCTSLTIEDLSLPNLESLGQNAFYGVSIKKISNLGKITALPVATSSTQNFGRKDVLEEVVLPDTVTSIPADSLCGYLKLNYIVINAITPPTLGNTNAISNTNNCPIYVPDASVEAYKQATNWSAYADRIMSMFYYLGYIDFADSNVLQVLLNAGYDTDADGKISIEEAAAVTDIGSLFQSNYKITSFDEFKYFTGVASIERTFSNTSSLETITFPSSLTTFSGYHGFSGSGIKRLTIPKNVTNTGTEFFKNCKRLETVVIETESSIRGATFADCPSLRQITTNADNTTYSSKNNCLYNKAGTTLIIGTANIQDLILDDVTKIESNACCNMVFAGTLTIPENITHIGENNANLMTGKIIIEGAATVSMKYAKIKTLLCKNKCDFSQWGSFGNTANLTTIILEGTSLNKGGDGMFDSSAVKSGKGYIYVPDSLVDSYKTDTKWSTYAAQIKPINVADTLPDISTVAENDLYKIGDVYWKAELVDEVLTWVEI